MSGRVTFEEVVALRERLAAAEQRATDAEARAERLAAALQWYADGNHYDIEMDDPHDRSFHNLRFGERHLIATDDGEHAIAALTAPAEQPDERAAAERAVIAAARPVLGMLRGTHSTFNTVIYSQALGDALEALDALDGAAKEV